MSKTAFLIQGFGVEHSKQRLHADRKMSEVITPACAAEGYELTRADKFTTPLITEPITSALATATLVVADLGALPWNQNVLVETGFRLASGRPIIFVADVDPEKGSLPTHLQDRRILPISDENKDDSISSLRKLIRDQQDDSATWQSDYPLIEFFAPLAGDDPARFVAVNEAAAKLYGFETASVLLSTDVAEADKKLQSYMPEKHRREFADDQQRLWSAAINPQRGEPVTAKVPAWIYREHRVRDRLGHVYWPVMLQHKFAPDRRGVVMRVAFLDVTNWECRTFQEREPDSVLKLPGFFRVRPFEYHVFLSYNSRDADEVRALCTILKRIGLRVWFDEYDMSQSEGVTKTLLHEMANARVVIAVMGSNGLGEWQENVELSTKLLGVVKEKQPFALLLLDELNDPKQPDLWLSYLPNAFKATLRDRVRLFLPKLTELEALAKQRGSFRDKVVKVLLDAIDQSFNYTEDDAASKG